MTRWALKAKLYRKFRKKPVIKSILKKENEIFIRLSAMIKMKPSKIIDMGCGNGNILEILTAIFPQTQICAMDISREMMQEIDIQDIKTASFIQGDALFAPLKSNVFDLCSAVGIAEYIKDKPLFLRELYRILSDNGYVIITFAPVNIFSYLRFMYAIRIYPDKESKMRQYILENGFTIVDLKKSIMQYQFLIKKRL